MQDFLTASTNRWGFGPQIHWQANQSVARAHVAGASADNKRALARFDGAVLTALRDTESALATYSRDLQRDEDLVVAQARAQEAERQAQRLYAGGRTDFLPLLDAERSLVQADGALANSHAEIAEDQVTIFLALGGGWE
jgi:outer membrane protein TolC